MLPGMEIQPKLPFPATRVQPPFEFLNTPAKHFSKQQNFIFGSQPPGIFNRHFHWLRQAIRPFIDFLFFGKIGLPILAPA